MKATTGTTEFSTRYGPVFIKVHDRPIADSLSKYGEWAQIEIDFLAQFISPCSLVLDVGGHVGLHARAFASLSKGVRVHSFEAQPQLASLLSRNAGQFDGQISVHAVAIGEKAGHAFIGRLPDDRNVNAGAQSVRTVAGSNDIAVEVRAIDDYQFDQVDFIKMDIEGYESLALKGAFKTISRDKPAIFCEVNSIGHASGLFDVMSAHDYAAYFVSTSAYNAQNSNGDPENMFGVAHETALLFLPADRQAPSQERASVCKRVDGIDELVPHFVAAPRYGDDTDHDRNWVALNEELAGVKRMLAEARAAAESSHADAANRDRKSVALTEELAAAKRTRSEADTAAVPRYADDADHDRDRPLDEQLAAAKRALAEARAAISRHQAEAAKHRSEIARLNEAASLYRIRHDRLSEYISDGQLAARRRSALGTLARKFGHSELAQICRTLVNSGLFDRKWYKDSYPDVGASRHEPVVHYVLFGAYEGRDPCKGFDTSYYLENNADIRNWGGNPLLHYIERGEKEGRWPNENFDPASYLNANPNADRTKMLLSQHLQGAGRDDHFKPSFRPAAPDWGDFEALAAHIAAPVASSATVDVIVPVYRGYDDTLACIMSVLMSTNRTDLELIVVDDASPEPELSRALDRLAGMGLITLLRNQKNLGFVATVNRGIALHPDRDVLLLNSDTLVFNDWLDRLKDHVTGGEVATVTPFTNNGTICSYPKFCKDNPGELDVPFAKIDEYAAAANRGTAVEVPTGVGFCMYVTRATFTKIGDLDVKTFGRGYGEENDFCVRAEAQNMRNLHALDVFVFHSGETSFSSGAAQAKKDGYRALVKKHPQYPGAVARYLSADPAKAARARLDIARLVEGRLARVVLCFTHGWGGGIDRYLADRAAAGMSSGEALLCAVPVRDGTAFRITNVASRGDFANLEPFAVEGSVSTLAEQLRGIVSHIEVHSTVRWSSKILDLVPDLARELGVTYGVMLHDYVPVCPQITLIDSSGHYCGETGSEQCNRCIGENPTSPSTIHPDWHSADMADIDAWRQRYSDFISGADEVAAPSQDVIQRMARYHPGREIVLRPHAESDRPFARKVALPYVGGVLKVVTIGAIGDHKGARILEACIDDARNRELPIAFSIVGFTSSQKLNGSSEIQITGGYKEDQVFDALDDVKAHVALLPSVWPETYSYTLSIALEAGYPVCTFDMGAPAERLRALRKGLLLPLETMSDPAKINDVLIEAFIRDRPRTSSGMPEATPLHEQLSQRTSEGLKNVS
ncbi:FkbM family methyltransferase [Aminobacter sp. SS-2016]|uniref:FkbM family methyltransferase n=1 Tax=Aminobacter sp. Y103A TaxID=1870862 RepID=UPI0025734624|nr:FkbM family methyltransferase [Aminobacter sp. SS-2016]